MMKKLTISTVVLMALAGLATSGAAFAKMPPLSEEAQAAAAAAKDKAAWSDKVAAYQLCVSQDKAVAHYFKTKKAGAKPTGDFPACANPGPYVAAQAAAKVGVADAQPVAAAGKPATPPAKK
jgi:hypothetical protein